ncbi:MAG: ankyrin repeat domain-containing protein [Brachybacterium tyrofermentans]
MNQSSEDPGPLSEESPPQDEAVVALAHSMLDAARRGDSAQLLPLIDQGAPVDLRDGDGNTPLMLAAYHGHAELVRELAARGADVDLANDRGQSPLAGVAFKGHTAVAQVLLQAGADADLGAPSARETAQYFQRAEIIALLEQAG